MDSRTQGRTTLNLNFKPTQEKDDMLSSRHKKSFEVPHPVEEYTKMQILDKRYRTNTVHTFCGIQSYSALKYLSLDHFGRFSTKIWEI